MGRIFIKEKIISPLQCFYFLDLLAVKTLPMAEFRFNKNPLEIVALKRQKSITMGAAHRKNEYSAY